MNHASRLYHGLQAFVSQSEWVDYRHLVVLVWMLIGWLEEGSVNLTRWITRVETKAVYAQSTQRRLLAGYTTLGLMWRRLYRPLIQSALADWPDPVLYLCLDTSSLWNQYCLIRLSVVYRARGIPVGWRVMAHGSTTDTDAASIRGGWW